MGEAPRSSSDGIAIPTPRGGARQRRAAAAGGGGGDPWEGDDARELARGSVRLVVPPAARERLARGGARSALFGAK